MPTTQAPRAHAERIRRIGVSAGVSLTGAAISAARPKDVKVVTPAREPQAVAS